MRRTLLVLGFVAAPWPALAQSSQFGVRGFGLPGRELSARAMATGGGFALFDEGSSRNPASISAMQGFTASFTGLQNWRTSENPAGEGSVRTNRFPQMIVGGQLGKRLLWLAGSISTYTDRDFSFASADTIDIRGEPVPVFDTTGSTGGLNDLRIAAAWGATPQLRVGGAVHAVTGSNRLTVRRSFGDSLYGPVAESAELEFTTFGLSAGLWYAPSPSLAVAAMGRFDGTTDIQVDSSGTELTRAGLPATLSGGVLYTPRASLLVAGQVTWRSWSRSSEGFEAIGGTGASDTFEAALGVEFLRDPERPRHLPLRAGIHWTQLPFPLEPGDEPTEFGVSAGSGFRFARDRGGVDLAVERTWRSEGSEYKETAWLLTVGVTVRP